MEYATGPPIGRSAPYDRGRPFRHDGSAAGECRSQRVGMSMTEPGWPIGVEGRVSRGRFPAYPEGTPRVAPATAR